MAKKVLVWLVIVMLILVIGLGTYFTIKNSNKQNLFDIVIPLSCTTSATGNTATSFPCPTNASSCTLNLKLDCNSQTTSQPVVTLRTNALTFADFNKAGTWILLFYNYRRSNKLQNRSNTF
jgi:uncharacterized protein (UPF0333 family)